MWLLAVLIGDCISDQGFFDKKMYGHFAGPKKSGCNNEVTILPRWLLGGVPLNKQISYYKVSTVTSNAKPTRLRH